MHSVIIAVFTAGAGWLLWKLLSDFFVRSPIDNIPGPPSPSLLRGHINQIYHRDGWRFIDMLGTRYNKVVKLNGLFGRRILYVFDPVALQQILIKDMDSYDAPEWFLEMSNLTVGRGLTGVRGEQHRKQRKMLNPVFSPQHLRSITPIFFNVAHKMCDGIEAQIGESVETVNVINWFSRTALELIGQGGLGYSLDSLDKPVANALGDALRELLPAAFEISEVQFLFKHLNKLGSPPFRGALAALLPMPTIQKLRELIDIIEVESKANLADKRTALQAGDDVVVRQVGEGKDIMSILLRANMAASEEDKLPENELVGQMSLMVLAGTDTTSNSLTMLLDIMTQRSEFQDKLRAELVEAQAQYGTDIPFDQLMNLPYMDALCRETLRLHPPATYIYRDSVKDTVLPLSEPIIGNDGSIIKEIPLPAETSIMIGGRAWNLSREVWGPDALEFNPDRWLSPLPSNVTDAHIPGPYSHIMTFGGGGRACIGFKFAELEMKVVLAAMIPKFKVYTSDYRDDIVWNLSNVMNPTVGKESMKPEFYVKLERLKENTKA
ncbi:hypothetical protein QCA50_011548 [Cerrena zonata]|uniref:Cytochrome P450 n=1 Tax=Cerrena zonata TaxID=2478898 RepID=A0AAW0FVE2_9APHY